MNLQPSYAIAVAWHNEKQHLAFLEAWGLKDKPIPRWVCFFQDLIKKGGARPKNEAVKIAIQTGAEYICVLDDDCYPYDCDSLDEFAEAHIAALQPANVRMYEQVMTPASRGTPYYTHGIVMPVAASMGFWRNVPDYDAPHQLCCPKDAKIEFKAEAIHGRYFPLCGMNFAFRASEWPWCQHIANVGRFDDIFMGYLWQRKAYANGQCFNLAGPKVFHSRQSNVFNNLRGEIDNLERNETLWRNIAIAELRSYEEMLQRCEFVL